MDESGTITFDNHAQKKQFPDIGRAIIDMYYKPLSLNHFLAVFDDEAFMVGFFILIYV